MSSYAELVGLTSQTLISSSFWGLSYFIVLLIPLYAYTRRFISIDVTPLFETIAYALFLQIGVMIVFSVIGVFIESINIGVNHLNPSKAFPIFFGNGSELLDTRWSAYAQQFSGDSSAQTSFGSEAKGVVFILNKYIGVVYRIFLVFAFLFSFYYIFAEYMKSEDSENNVFQRLYGTMFKVISFMLLVNIHASVGVAYVSYFGVEDSKATNMISAFQSIIAEIFYT